MEIGVYEQLRQLIAAMVTGGMIGLLYDLTCVVTDGLKIALRCFRFLTVILSAFLVFAAARASGAGTRLFFPTAAGGGICLYLWALHPMICHDLKRIKHFFALKFK